MAAEVEAVSVICEVAFGDRVVTRMTVHNPDPHSFDLSRALVLAIYAYESRMHRPPPEIKLTSIDSSVLHILGLRYQTLDGQMHTMRGDEIMRMMAFNAALDRAGKKKDEEPKP